eukprot:TRINITY_DN55070_c0_g1_i1.p1 TRINITY_DN55070_c0_g1~~TRINITY_DN55070_c0_g1_i1.p1  ORF type:complete len:1003 (-),score=159.16 TRINITY_DN55070_c0_g1_i1:223-3231(-)
MNATRALSVVSPALASSAAVAADDFRASRDVSPTPPPLAFLSQDQPSQIGDAVAAEIPDRELGCALSRLSLRCHDTGLYPDSSGLFSGFGLESWKHRDNKAIFDQAVQVRRHAIPAALDKGLPCRGSSARSKAELQEMLDEVRGALKHLDRHAATGADGRPPWMAAPAGSGKSGHPASLGGTVWDPLRIRYLFREEGFDVLVVFCPQALLTGMAVDVLALIAALYGRCLSGTGCKENAVIFFDTLMMYASLKFSMIHGYASEVSAEQLLWDWPIDALEQHIWQGYERLFRLVWPNRPRDACKCGENGYYWNSLLAHFHAADHMSPKELDHLKVEGGPAWTALAGAGHCDIFVDTRLIFAVYGDTSDCIPGGVLEHIACVHWHTARGQPAAALFFAENALRLTALGGYCLDVVELPFTRAGILHNYGWLMSLWNPSDIAWKPPPLKGPVPSWRLGGPSRQPVGPPRRRCVVDIADACVESGRVLVIDAEGFLPLEQVLMCSDEGFAPAALIRSDHAGEMVAWEGDGRSRRAAFVLNVGHSRNFYHESHHVLPAVLRMVEARHRYGLTPADVDLYLVRPEKETSVEEDESWLAHWRTRYAAALGIITADQSQITLLRKVIARRCYPLLLWGHAEMRSDRRHSVWRIPRAGRTVHSLPPATSWPWTPTAVAAQMALQPTSSQNCSVRSVSKYGSSEYVIPSGRGSSALLPTKAADAIESFGDARQLRSIGASMRRHIRLESLSRRFWGGGRGGPDDRGGGQPRVLLVQRHQNDKRSFLNFDELRAALRRAGSQRGYGSRGGDDQKCQNASLSWRRLCRRQGWRVLSIQDLRQWSVPSQMAMFHGADVVVGFSGAGLSWLTMLAEHGGAVLEVIPSDLTEELYRCPEAWAANPIGTYGGLSRLAGVEHVCLRSGTLGTTSSAMNTWNQRGSWKLADYNVDSRKIAEWVHSAVVRVLRTRRTRRQRRRLGRRADPERAPSRHWRGPRGAAAAAAASTSSSTHRPVRR